MLTGLGAMIPVVGIVYTSVRIHQLSIMIEDLADSTISGLGNIAEELTAMRVIVIQNRVAYQAINKIKDIRDEAHGIHTGGMWEDILNRLENGGSWILEAIIIVIAIVLTLCIMINICPTCCAAFANSCARCIPKGGTTPHHTHEDEGQEMVDKDGF